MSLFNDLSKSVMLRQSIGGVLGGGRLGAAIGAAAENVAMREFDKVTGGVLDHNIGTVRQVADILGDISHDNLGESGLRLLGTGLFDKLLSGTAGFASQALHLFSKNPLFGDLTPLEAKNLIAEMQAVTFSKKNLFLIDIESRAHGDHGKTFSLLCTDVGYSAQAVSGEKHRVGAAQIDSISASEPVELRMTTLDTKRGFIRQWFKDNFALVTHLDGTVGVPDDYLIKIAITQGVITHGAQANGYRDEGLFRPASIETSLDRREDGLQEIIMNFTQLDTYRGF